MRSTTYVRDTLATLARRTLDGEDFFFALREWLDDLYGAFEPSERQAMLDDRPTDLDDPHLNAFLGALAEHLVQSPAAFRRRGVMITAGLLERM